MPYIAYNPAHVRRDSVEVQRQKTRDYIAEQTQYSVYLNSAKDNPSVWERQLGRAFTTPELENRLKKLNPNLCFERHPFKPDKKCLYHIDQRGKQFICAYENGFSPEHSVMRTKTEEVWNGDTHINKKDLPKGEFVPGRGFIWDSPVNPGFKHVEIPYGERIRGWRTVLIKLLASGLCTINSVENIFGCDDTAEWKQHTGKGKTGIPW